MDTEHARRYYIIYYLRDTSVLFVPSVIQLLEERLSI